MAQTLKSEVKYIVISGIDGSGKTTIIKALQEELHRQGIRTRYIWMRYNHYLVKVLNAFARMAGLSVQTNYGGKKVWEHRYYESPLFYKLYIFCSYIDNAFAARKVKQTSGVNFQYVICDRWINDIIADIGSEFRKNDILQSRWYQKFQQILPGNTIQFVVTRPEESLLRDREDNRYDIHFSHRLNLYQKMPQQGCAIEVNNSGTIAESVSYILKNIS